MFYRLASARLQNPGKPRIFERMTRKYNRGELGHLLSFLQRHEEDPRIVYAPEDRELVIPLIQEGFIKAAIIPAADSESFAGLTWRAQEYEVEDYDEGTIAQQFFVRDDNLYLYEGSKKLSDEEAAALPGVVRESFTRLSEFIYPKENWTPLKPLRQLANKASDLLWAWTPGAKLEKPVTQTAEWLDDHFPRRQTNLLLLWQEAGQGKATVMPNLHNDTGVTVHLSGHTPMEYLVGGVTDDQWEILQKNRMGERDQLLTHYPQLADRIRRLNPGDMVVFGPELVHRSSPEAGEKGQLNFAAEPAGSSGWPYDLNHDG